MNQQRQGRSLSALNTTPATSLRTNMFFADRILPGLTTAATLIGASVTVLAQSLFDPTAQIAEKVVGGSILFAVGWMVVRWTFKLIGEVRAIAAEDRSAAVEREKIAAERERLLLAQLQKQNEVNAELHAQLTTERQMRVSLERAGLIEHRGSGREGTD